MSGALPEISGKSRTQTPISMGLGGLRQGPGQERGWGVCEPERLMTGTASRKGMLMRLQTPKVGWRVAIKSRKGTKHRERVLPPLGEGAQREINLLLPPSNSSMSGLADRENARATPELKWLLSNFDGGVRSIDRGQSQSSIEV